MECASRTVLFPPANGSGQAPATMPAPMAGVHGPVPFNAVVCMQSESNLTSVIAAQQSAAIIETASDAIVCKRLDGTVTSWNRAAEHLYGYTAEQIVGQSIDLLLPEDRLQEEAVLIARLHGGERIPPFETVRQRSDGVLIDVEVAVASMCDSAGALIGASEIARDIAHLTATRHRERRLFTFMKALTRAIQATARPTSDAELFKELCRICVELGGANACFLIENDGDTIGVKAHLGLSEAGALSIVAFLARNQAAASSLVIGEPVVMTDISGWLGADAPVERLPSGEAGLAALPFKRGAGVSGTLVVLAKDPGFFDAAAMELLRDLAADLSYALTNRARDIEFQGIVESAMDAIIAVDSKHRILRFNQAACELFLWPAQEAVGQPIERIIPQRFRAGHGLLMDRFAVTESMPRRMGAARPLMGLRADGTEVPIEATVSRFGSGPDLRMIVVIRDASSLRVAESALRAQKEAEAANRAKTDFLSHMSHELRTPLNAVLGFAQVMLSDPELLQASRQRTQLGHIQAAGRHLHALVSDLLDMARLEAGLLSVQSVAVSLEDALHEVLELLGPTANTAGVSVIVPDGQGAPRFIQADPTRFRQVLSNLISNSIKYTRFGGSVRIETQAVNGMLRVRVVDSGIGMTRQQMEHLFEPYNRLGREKSSISGTGIGLVVTKKLVELMGGILEVSSEPNAGTCVDVTLPIAANVTEHVDASASSRLEAGEPSGVVLSVEDNEVNQLLLDSVFRRWPQIRLVHAADGATGLDLARRLHPDLVLLDMNLPDMNGLQFMEAVAADPQLPSIQVIALSASAMPEDVDSALRSGILDYVTKPLDVAQFSKSLLSILGSRSISDIEIK